MGGLHFKRGEPEKPKRRKMLGLHPVPTMVTLGNLLCGFASIVLSMRAYRVKAEVVTLDLYWAAILIFVAMVCDALDGRVARWTKTASRFGMEMDSLSDVVSFGVAPAVLVKAFLDLFGERLGFVPFPDRYLWLMLATYVACAALRLARYNVEAVGGHRDFFFGVPSPAAAGCAASLAVFLAALAEGAWPGAPIPPNESFLGHLDQENRLWIMGWTLRVFPFLMLLLGILMVSRLHYIHIGDKLLGRKKSFTHFLLMGLGMVLVVMQHEIILPLAFNGYMAFGILNEIRFNLLPHHRPKDWQEGLAALAAGGAEKDGGEGQGTASPGESAPEKIP